MSTSSRIPLSSDISSQKFNHAVWVAIAEFFSKYQGVRISELNQKTFLSCKNFVTNSEISRLFPFTS